MMHLDDMALFVEVVKAKSFRGAAEALGMPNSTVSRRISMLEKALGLRLLHRTTRRIELTEAGQVYYERSKRIVEEARLAHLELGDMLAQPTGVLRASLPVDFAVTYLAPLVAEFARLYPGISFEIDLTPRRIDLVSERFDIAIRMGEPEDSHLIARPLARLVPHLYAAPSYLALRGEPISPQDLGRHDCMGMIREGHWMLTRGDSQCEVPVGGRFHLNNVGMIKRLSTLGLGVILVPEEIVADELASSQLQRILPDWQGKPMPVYALTETRLLPAKTQRFIEFLREKLASKR
ncbi:LysR family transcriptional regulator [Novosphingobium profundi]|uniref:LysR family transcriptional regulator n=1 Tax=Novosphingobium profundi TaxID=1774954 RepID=UPI001BDA77B8|nr:LysR family transcriptional regulator [Novosphingobium profundi]MBT0671128.1 LysR family transcriptional regulator [Novosphingobium profundi]